MNEIPSLTVTRTGVEDALPSGVAAECFLVDNDGNVVLVITNPSGAPRTVTVEATATFAGVDVADAEIVVPAMSTIYRGPWPPVLYNDEQGRVVVGDDSLGELLYSSLRI